MKMLLVTGLSGAGKSTALNAMEDLGHETVDNLPLSLLPLLLSSETHGDKLVVVGVDVRSRDFSPELFHRSLETIRARQGYEVTILFLDCDDEVLRRRYTETRRKHPLAQDRPVLSGIEQERELLRDIQQQADVVINSTDIPAAELRQMVQQRFGEDQSTLSIFLQSFAYRNGIPREADLVFDVRFLRNPHYVEALRDKTGQDAEVGKYIEQDEIFAAFFENLSHLVMPLLPRYRQEGKSYLTIAVGCTGGRHRSVYTVEKLAAALEKAGYSINYRHRELQ